MLQNEYEYLDVFSIIYDLVAIIGADTAEHGPAKVPTRRHKYA